MRVHRVHELSGAQQPTQSAARPSAKKFRQCSNAALQRDASHAHSNPFQDNKHMDLLQLCQWRYATKKMDPARSVPDEVVARILEVARLAPSSSGLQPYEILLIRDPELRRRIRAAANDQSQITDGSHLLVFAAWDNYTPERIHRVFDQTNVDRGVTIPGWEDYRQRLLGAYPQRSADVNFEHAARQAYIGLGFAMVAAANEGVDSTPMEGFDPAAVDEILGLRAKGLRSVLLLPLGYRDEQNDWLVKLNKSRRPMREFVTEVA
jgi:nitroreductase